MATAGQRARGILQSAFATGLGFAGFSALQQSIASLVSTVADFEQAMSTVRAITGATDQDFRRLSDTSRTLGRTTRFTATQAAEGMLFLARAGFNTNQVLGAVDGTLRLAQAGALDLGSAADIATNILTGFRLEVSQTGNVVDILAFAANNSNTNVQQLGDAMKFVAPVAAGLGVQVETATAAVSALSNAGLQASLAGTGLRRVLSELESPAVKTQRILRAVGLTADDVRVSQVGLVAAITRLRDAGVDAGLALEIFGDRGGPAFEVLQNAIPFVRQMEERLMSVDGFSRMVAEVMDNNLRGALLAVASAAEGVVLAFADLGASAAFAQGLGGITQSLRFLADQAENVQLIIAAVGVVFGARLLRSVGLAAASFTSAALQGRGLARQLTSIRGASLSASQQLLATASAAGVLRSAMGALGGPFGVIALVAFGLSEIVMTSREVAGQFAGLEAATDAFTRSFETNTGEIDRNVRALEGAVQARRRLLREGQGGIGGAVQRLFGGSGGFSLEELEAGRLPRQLESAVVRRRDIALSRVEDLTSARQRAIEEARRQAQLSIGDLPPTERTREERRLQEDILRVTRLQDEIGQEVRELIRVAEITPREISHTVETAFGTTVESNRAAVENAQQVLDVTARQARRFLDDQRIASRNFVTDIQTGGTPIQLSPLGVTGERIDPNEQRGQSPAERLEQQLQLQEEAARRGRQLSAEERTQVLLTQRAYEDLTEAQRNALIAQARRVDDARAASQQGRQAAEARDALREREVQDTIAAQERIAQITQDARQVTLGSALSEQDIVRRNADALVAEVERLAQRRTISELEASNAVIEIRRAEQTQLNQITEAAEAARDRDAEERARDQADALRDVQRRLVRVGLATRDVVAEEEAWADTIRARLDLQTEAGQRASDDLDRIIEQQRRLQSQNPFDGFIVGLEQFSASAQTNAEAARDFLVGAIESATSSMSNAFAEFARTGQLSFGDLVDSMLADLTRLASQQIFQQLFGAILGSFSPGPTGPTGSGGAGPTFGGIRLGGATGGLVYVGGDGVASIIRGAGAVPAFGPGGVVRGPGSGTSDSVLARLSNGEFVVNARATRAALPYLQALNNSIPAYQRGGFVGREPPPPGPDREDAPVQFQFFDQRVVRGNEDAGQLTVEQGRGPGGQRQIRAYLRNTVRGDIAGGSLDDVFEARFGLQPRRVRG